MHNKYRTRRVYLFCFLRVCLCVCVVVVVLFVLFVIASVTQIAQALPPPTPLVSQSCRKVSNDQRTRWLNTRSEKQRRRRQQAVVLCRACQEKGNVASASFSSPNNRIHPLRSCVRKRARAERFGRFGRIDAGRSHQFPCTSPLLRTRSSVRRMRTNSVSFNFVQIVSLNEVSVLRLLRAVCFPRRESNVVLRPAAGAAPSRLSLLELTSINGPLESLTRCTRRTSYSCSAIKRPQSSEYQ